MAIFLEWDLETLLTCNSAKNKSFRWVNPLIRITDKEIEEFVKITGLPADKNKRDAKRPVREAIEAIEHMPGTKSYFYFEFKKSIQSKLRAMTNKGI